MKWRKAAKIDSNQPVIVAALRSIPGCTVAVGHDDILVGYKGRTLWYEIKEPGAVSKVTGQVLQSAKKPAQIELEANWKGHYRIVSSLDEILQDLGAL